MIDRIKDAFRKPTPEEFLADLNSRVDRGFGQYSALSETQRSYVDKYGPQYSVISYNLNALSRGTMYDDERTFWHKIFAQRLTKTLEEGTTEEKTQGILALLDYTGFSK